MNIQIKEIHSKHKPEEYVKSVNNMTSLLGDKAPITNLSEIKWTKLVETTKDVIGYGSYGHMCGINITICDDDDRYTLSVIFNYLPEKENLNDKITEIVSTIDYKNNSDKWDIGDL